MQDLKYQINDQKLTAADKNEKFNKLQSLYVKVTDDLDDKNKKFN